MNDKMQTLSDVMDPARATALWATLGQPQQISQGDVLPPFFHQIYFWDPQPPARLGRDGHPQLGGLIPDLGLPRRMWAGGRLKFHAPLRAGLVAERHSVCEAATRKHGRSGALGIVTLRHEIWQGGQCCVTDWQDLIYREDPAMNARRPAPCPARQDEQSAQEIAFNPTVLFRYSALTFNGHRIHYDRDYARDVEGYAGLVVHGPLLAQHLILMAQRELGVLQSFDFRATAPLMDFETATLCWCDGSAWVRGPDGQQCMLAEAE
jgi:3-methylfumaryl-CoA hydratase